MKQSTAHKFQILVAVVCSWLFFQGLHGLLWPEITFKIKVTSPAPKQSVQVFYDFNDGYSERNSQSKKALEANKQTTLSFVLPKEKLANLRLDLGDVKGKWTLEQASFLISAPFALSHEIQYSSAQVREKLLLRNQTKWGEGPKAIVYSLGNDPFLEFSGKQPLGPLYQSKIYWFSYLLYFILVPFSFWVSYRAISLIKRDFYKLKILGQEKTQQKLLYLNPYPRLEPCEFHQFYIHNC